MDPEEDLWLDCAAAGGEPAHTHKVVANNTTKHRNGPCFTSVTSLEKRSPPRSSARPDSVSKIPRTSKSWSASAYPWRLHREYTSRAPAWLAAKDAQW